MYKVTFPFTGTLASIALLLFISSHELIGIENLLEEVEESDTGVVSPPTRRVSTGPMTIKATIRILIGFGIGVKRSFSQLIAL